MILAGAAALILLIVGGLLLSKSTNKPSATPTPTATDETAKFTLADIATHAVETDCWLTIGGKVYDVTKYIPSHPGKAEILRGCGKDATELFMTHGKEGGQPHLPSTEAVLKIFYIGDLKN